MNEKFNKYIINGIFKRTFERRKNIFLLIICLFFSIIIKLYFAAPSRLFEAHYIALEIVEHGTFRYMLNGSWNYNYQFPLYPILIAPGYYTGYGPQLAILLNIAFGTTAAWIVYLIGLRLNHWRNGNLAIVASIITAFHPFLSFYQVSGVHSFALDMLLAVALTYYSIECRIYRIRTVFYVAFVSGLILLERPTLIFFGFPMFYSLLKRDYARIPVKSIILLLLPVLMISSWLLRNGIIYGKFSYISSTGQNLWIGIQEDTEGTAQLPNGDSYYNLLSAEQLRTLSNLGPLEMNEYFLQLYKNQLNGTVFWRMYMIKIRNFWFSRSSLGVDYGGLIPSWGYLVLRVYGLILVILILFSFQRRNFIIMSIFFSILSLSVIQAIFYVEMRHRFVAEPLILLLALVQIQEMLVGDEHNRTA
jgi:hypothetical protein